MSYCTVNNFQVAPGTYTHDYSKEEVESALGCCQKFVCGIPCPAPYNTDGAAVDFGVPVVLVTCSWVIMGFFIALAYSKRVDYRGFFVCHRTLPLYIVTFALLAQGLDTSSSLGNAANNFKNSFWDGAVVPIGVGLSLILNGLLLAAPINSMGLLTLPDLFRRKYGVLMEVMVSVIEIGSFTVLLAGNLVGTSLVLQFCFGLPKGAGILISAVVLAVYTACGGMYSVALTDIPQALGGLSGLLVTALYVLATHRDRMMPTASKGFAVDLGGNVTAHTQGYSGPRTCGGARNASTGTLDRVCDNFAFPNGSQIIYSRGMTDPDAYAPLPNALLYNWCSIFVLGFGNLCALDFQARCIAAKCPRTARTACFLAGGLLLVVALPFGVLGALARRHYGPDSPYAAFEVDSCSKPLGRPSCAQWLPEENTAVFMTLWEQTPRALGAWAMMAIVTASVSTADGAILATATVTAHNLWRKVPRIGSNQSNLLMLSRLFVMPMTALAGLTALLSYRTAYLLVVAFDIVTAGVLVPLLAAVYLPRVSPNAGLLSCLAGSLLRISLEQLLPKDGSLVAPLGSYALSYGHAVPGLPSFLEVEPPDLIAAAGVWNPDRVQCQQVPLSDWTGVDSLLSPLFSLVVLGAVSLLEWRWPRLDLLWFVPKAWRQATPLYQCEDASVHGGGGSDGGSGERLQSGRGWGAAAALRPAQSSRLFRRRLIMPSVPEEDHNDNDAFSDGIGGGSGYLNGGGDGSEYLASGGVGSGGQYEGGHVAGNDGSGRPGVGDTRGEGCPGPRGAAWRAAVGRRMRERAAAAAVSDVAAAAGGGGSFQSSSKTSGSFCSNVSGIVGRRNSGDSIAAAAGGGNGREGMETVEEPAGAVAAVVHVA